jgi:hypothetical protein
MTTLYSFPKTPLPPKNPLAPKPALFFIGGKSNITYSTPLFPTPPKTTNPQNAQKHPKTAPSCPTSCFLSLQLIHAQLWPNLPQFSVILGEK